ncbi:hypothetical protein K7X08_034131 [Anisodus acutangulus]|uniref:Uncharacterized protein n=1 Tax=Anisodus acutangulus TaxID=402998 RepID=A0A9Q1M645_9SOLA|nr:hypothetical protein K7X08_034131 [Anisodus acutangulus]
MIIVEQVDDGKAMGREVEEIEEDASDLKVQRSLLLQMLMKKYTLVQNKLEIRDNTSMEGMSSSEEYVILSNKDSLHEEAPIVEGVEISTSRDIIRSLIEKALMTYCYPHSKGDYEVGQIPIIVDALVMKKNVNVMSVLKKSSPNKELHSLVSHDMNWLDSGPKEGALMKGNCPGSDMKLSEEEDLRQHITDVCKKADITSHESIKSSKKGRKSKNGGEVQAPKTQVKKAQTVFKNIEPSRILPRGMLLLI